MLKVVDGQLIAAFELETRQFSQVFTGQFDLDFNEDGYVTLKMVSFQAGRLPVPASEIGNCLRENSGDCVLAESAGEWLEKLEEVSFNPVLDNLPHRRRARILDYAVTDTGI